MERLIFVTWIFELHILISSDRTLSSEKNDIKIIEIGFSFDSMVIYQNMVIFNFSPHTRDISGRDNGFITWNYTLI